MIQRKRNGGVGVVRYVALALTLILGIVLGTLGNQMLSAQQVDKKTPLLKADLSGIPGQEGYVVLHEMSPGAMDERHYHNGDVFLYILEGSETIEVVGQAPVSVKAGQSYHIPSKVVIAPKNDSATAPVKFITFAVVPKGQPVSVSVK
jgi:quercetin dioxygenase-like cupin family protein